MIKSTQYFIPLFALLLSFKEMPISWAAAQSEGRGKEDLQIMFDPFKEKFFFSSVKIKGHTMQDAQNQKLTIKGEVTLAEYPGMPGKKEGSRYSLIDLVKYYDFRMNLETPIHEEHFNETSFYGSAIINGESIENNFFCTLKEQEGKEIKEDSQISIEINLSYYVPIRVKDENNQERGLLLVPVWSILSGSGIQGKDKKELVIIDQNGNSEIDKAIFIGSRSESLANLQTYKDEIKLQKEGDSYTVTAFTLKLTEKEIKKFLAMQLSLLEKGEDGSKKDVKNRDEVIQKLRDYLLSKQVKETDLVDKSVFKKATSWYFFVTGAIVGAVLTLVACSHRSASKKAANHKK